MVGVDHVEFPQVVLSVMVAGRFPFAARLLGLWNPPARVQPGCLLEYARFVAAELMATLALDLHVHAI